MKSERKLIIDLFQDLIEVNNYLNEAESICTYLRDKRELYNDFLDKGKGDYFIERMTTKAIRAINEAQHAIDCTIARTSIALNELK